MVNQGKGYVQLKGPFIGGFDEKGGPLHAYEFPVDIKSEKVIRVSVQLYNNWPFEAFNSTEEMDIFTIKGNHLYGLNGQPTDKLDFIIGESGTLELDELSNLELTHFWFNKDMPASTLIEVELRDF